MGLIKAGLGAVGGVLADQWKEMFACDSLSSDVLVAKGEKMNSKRSSNKKGSDNVISDGSLITVNEGQAMLITEQGKVVEFCAEAGEFVYDASSEPSLFSGPLSESIKKTFSSIGKRFTFGGLAPKDQRVYYFNIKEIMDNKYGTPSPILYRFVEPKSGLDIDLSLRCNGSYSYKITNPLLFYSNVSGNVEEEYTREQLDGQLKAEFITALQPAMAKIGESGIRPSDISGHALELCDTLSEALSAKWQELRGISLVVVNMNPPTLSEDDKDAFNDFQKMAVFQNAGMAAANLVAAQGEAMRTAAGNPNGAMMGFMGMNMAGVAGGADINSLYNKQAQESVREGSKLHKWKCDCGVENTGNFCSNCGNPKPRLWKCDCGAENAGKFCSNCGKPMGEEVIWECVCGTENSGKFCSNCGKPRIGG
ncbi:MAG: SPFH domain-containing protein [Oscillospiraceae bacterium]|jgi:membrane protease subunit (stomatin/prohibitin family)|nr:SPFH domain-containing protein [Oscillospiraceae bacterium]